MSPKAPRPSFAEFAASAPKPGGACWFCTISERAEIEEAVLAGRASKVAALRYLKHVCGYEQATEARVYRHFRDCVQS